MLETGRKKSATFKQGALRLWHEQFGRTIQGALVVAIMLGIHARTLQTWDTQYDGTLESLLAKSSRPHTPDRKQHTHEEDDLIRWVFETYPDRGMFEKFGILRYDKGYRRSKEGFKKRTHVLGLKQKRVKPQATRQTYHCATDIGGKIQIDVKYVPVESFCKTYWYRGKRHYQYTAKDEASKVVFRYWYIEIGHDTTIDFVQRFMNKTRIYPQVIQTDNGIEFCNPANPNKAYKFGKWCESMGIEHKRVRPRAPHLQGQVETIHRVDNENFYSRNKFKSFEDLIEKGIEWTERHNKYCTHRRLKCDITGMRDISPLHKFKSLLHLAKQGKATAHIYKDAKPELAYEKFH